jgi:hypothetical protein
MESKRCAGCGESFHPRTQTPKQSYCASAACQRERRRRWQKARRQADPDYRENQARAQAAWATQHPNYWREYRRTHPEYGDRNRLLQKGRDARRPERSLAKMDASTRETSMPSGIYRLSPVTRDDLAKSDAWMVRITTVSMPCAPSG